MTRSRAEREAEAKAIKAEFEASERRFAEREQAQNDFKAALRGELLAFQEVLDPDASPSLDQAHRLLDVSDIEATTFRLPEGGKPGNITSEMGTLGHPAPAKFGFHRIEDVVPYLRSVVLRLLRDGSLIARGYDGGHHAVQIAVSRWQSLHPAFDQSSATSLDKAFSGITVTRPKRPTKLKRLSVADQRSWGETYVSQCEKEGVTPTLKQTEAAALKVGMRRDRAREIIKTLRPDWNSRAGRRRK